MLSTGTGSKRAWQYGSISCREAFSWVRHKTCHTRHFLSITQLLCFVTLARSLMQFCKLSLNNDYYNMISMTLLWRPAPACREQKWCAAADQNQ
jgi:hypothetical protein